MITPVDWLSVLPTPEGIMAGWSIEPFSHLASWPSFDAGWFFAQNQSAIQSVDILADFQKAWNNFIKSGQVWALGIGFFLGWLFRNFTGS